MYNNSNYSVTSHMNFGPGFHNMESIGEQNYNQRNNMNNNLNNVFSNGNYNIQDNNHSVINPQVNLPPIVYCNVPIPIPLSMLYMNNPLNYGGITIPNNNYNLNTNTNHYAFNNNNLISNSIKNIEQNNIKQNEIDKNEKDFIDVINDDYSLNIFQDKEPEKFKKFFYDRIGIICKEYENEISKKKRFFKIYIKKLSNKYIFDYYKIKRENYDIKENFDLINEYLAEKNLDKKEINNMSEKMKKECICAKDIILFIFNEFCFLSPFTISVYIPHILKVELKNSFLTHFLKNKDLEINDFIIDQEYNEYSLFIKMLNIRLENLKNNDYANGSEFGLGINITGDKGFLYTTIPTELIERSILEIDLNIFGNKYIGGYSSIKISTIRNAFSSSNNEDERNFFEKNEDYLRGMTTQELILFFICHELKEYIKLPRLIIYENLMDLKGNKIYINKQLNFIEFDSILLSKNKFTYNNEFPIRIQKFFEIDKNNVSDKTNTDNSNFAIEKDDLYFFEIKTSLKIDNIEKILLNIIISFQEFYNLFIKNKFIDEKSIPNIILIYDFHKIEFDFKIILNKILNRLKNEFKFNIQIIYCFPNYSYFSFDKINTDLKEMKKEIQDIKEQNKIEIQKLKEQNKIEIQKLKENNEKLMNELSELRNNFTIKK